MKWLGKKQNSIVMLLRHSNSTLLQLGLESQYSQKLAIYKLVQMSQGVGNKLKHSAHK